MDGWKTYRLDWLLKDLFGVQEDLEELFHVPKENIRVIQPDHGFWLRR
jgi:hypothetical protein